MSDQIIDIIDVAVPGPTGDVTPEALQALADTEGARDQAITARNESRGARDEAEEWRDQAEAFSGTVVEFQDAAIAELMDTQGSETQTQLNAAIDQATSRLMLMPGMNLDIWDAVDSPGNNYATWLTYITTQLGGTATSQTLGTDSYGTGITCFTAGSGVLNIVIVGGQHPGEALGQMGGLAFFKAFSTGQHPAMQALREEVTIHWIPTLVPGGYKNVVGDGRKNANGVNVNRDWPVNWVVIAGETGAAPFSQPESIIVRDLVDDVDARMVFDLHNFNTGSGRPFATATTGNNFQTKTLTHREAMSNWQRANPDAPAITQYSTPGTEYSTLGNWAGKHIRYDKGHLNAMSVIIECDGAVGGSNSDMLTRQTARWWGSLIHQMILTWLSSGQTDEVAPVFAYRGWCNPVGSDVNVSDGGFLIEGDQWQVLRFFNTSNGVGNVDYIKVPLRHPGHFVVNWVVGIQQTASNSTDVSVGISITKEGDPTPTAPIGSTVKREKMRQNDRGNIAGTYRAEPHLTVPDNNMYEIRLWARCSDPDQLVRLNSGAGADLNAMLLQSGLPNYQPATLTG